MYNNFVETLDLETGDDALYTLKYSFYLLTFIEKFKISEMTPNSGGRPTMNRIRLSLISVSIH